MRDRPSTASPDPPDPGRVVERLREQYWDDLGQAPDEAVPGEVVQVLGFRLDEQRYAIQLGHCDCVVRVPRLVRLPRCPLTLLGAFGLRGEVIPVVALRRMLGLAERPPGVRSRLVVVRAEGQTAGLVADRVDSVGEVAGPWAPPGDTRVVIDPEVPDGVHRLSVGSLLRRALAELTEAPKPPGDNP